MDCVLLTKSLKQQYLGHLINASGLRPSNKKLKAARDMPAPKNVTLLGACYLIIISLNMATKFAPCTNYSVRKSNDIFQLKVFQ